MSRARRAREGRNGKNDNLNIFRERLPTPALDAFDLLNLHGPTLAAALVAIAKKCALCPPPRISAAGPTRDG